MQLTTTDNFRTLSYLSELNKPAAVCNPVWTEYPLLLHKQSADTREYSLTQITFVLVLPIVIIFSLSGCGTIFEGYTLVITQTCVSVHTLILSTP